MGNYRLNGSERLGVEFGSTRIKAVLIDSSFNTLATGIYDWQNRLENGVWTYHYDDIWQGLQGAYKSLNEQCELKFGSKIKALAALGFSAMMHGYLPLDSSGNPLCEFRTWRNTATAQSAKELTELFDFNIPQRWSIAHLYQAILNNEEHVGDIAYLTTLAGYVHYKLCGQKALGIGEASGMFPIDSQSLCYDERMIKKFSDLENVKKYSWNITDILPQILLAGENAGTLTADGARLIDPSGCLKAGALMCPPEGDAGTGMVATNSIAERTGNISAGTSVFSMVVLERRLSRVYEQIDMVTTPTGKPVAMVHCNNCCGDLDCWVSLFIEFSKMLDSSVTKPQIYDMLYNAALSGDDDCGGLLTYNYFSGEPVVDMNCGRPVFTRTQNADFNLSNFMRAQIFTAAATLKIGMEILEKENVKIDRLMGHGGLFKTKEVGQRLMAGAMNAPVSVSAEAGEGGAWGIAVLAAYALDGCGKSLDDYLNASVFSKQEITTVLPDDKDVNGFKEYMRLFKRGLDIEKTAAQII